MTNYTKEAKLVQAVIEYAVDCLRQGDLRSLEKLGFKRTDLNDLRRLNLGDLRYIRAIHYHMVDMVLDRVKLHMIMQYLERERDEQETIEYLFRHDAPLSILHQLHGLNSKDCVFYRALYDTPAHNGRSREATEEEVWKVWGVVNRLGKSQEVDRWVAADWIAIHKEADVPLRIIWRIVSDSGAGKDRAPEDAPVDVPAQ
jgi:hypothetical protein